MVTKYISKPNDVIDLICFNHYGKTDGLVEKVLQANLGLAEYGSHLPAGVEIVLPDLIPKEGEVVQLWD